MLARSKLTCLMAGILLLLVLPQYGYAHGMSEADKLAITEGGNLRYLWLGATHMLSGYDHLLFVFGIIFFLTSFRDIVKYITAFTLGHSVTLIFAFANIDGFRKYLNVAALTVMLLVLPILYRMAHRKEEEAEGRHVLDLGVET